MILITGAAGFIGFHVASKLLKQGLSVIGIDNMNDYYDVSLKNARLAQLKKNKHFTFYKGNIADPKAIEKLRDKHKNDISFILHLAAQAGVRYSLENPMAYCESNLTGHMQMLELARYQTENTTHFRHFVYASSSSVYGGNKKQPFAADDPVENPVSLYAATKRSGEILTQSYANLYNIPSTGLRFFTVYGPYGRPDMAYFSFTKNILEEKPITVFNNGNMRRDFTWIDDCVDGIISAVNTPPKNGKSPYCLHGAPHRIFNLGNNKPEQLIDFVNIIEQAADKRATIDMLDHMMPGDVIETYADIAPAQKILKYAPKTPIAEGLPKFVEWYKEFYKSQNKL